MKLTTVSALLISCSLSLALGHSVVGKEKDADAGDSESEVRIEKTILARKVEDGFEPVKSFKPSDTFSVAVYLNGAKIGTRLKAIWILVDADGWKRIKRSSKKILRPHGKQSKAWKNRTASISISRTTTSIRVVITKPRFI